MVESIVAPAELMSKLVVVVPKTTFLVPLVAILIPWLTLSLPILITPPLLFIETAPLESKSTLLVTVERTPPSILTVAVPSVTTTSSLAERTNLPSPVAWLLVASTVIVLLAASSAFNFKLLTVTSPVNVVVLSTESVPFVLTFPEVSATVNLSVSTAIPALAFNKPDAVIPAVVVKPVTSNVPPRVVAPVPLTVNVPFVIVLPLVATVNLSVSTAIPPLEFVRPVVVWLPPIVTLLLALIVVNEPVLGVVPPIGVLLIVPPVTTGLVKVLLVKVCVWSLKTNSSFPVKSGRVIVLFAVRSLTANSYLWLELLSLILGRVRVAPVGIFCVLEST